MQKNNTFNYFLFNFEQSNKIKCLFLTKTRPHVKKSNLPNLIVRYPPTSVRSLAVHDQSHLSQALAQMTTTRSCSRSFDKHTCAKCLLHTALYNCLLRSSVGLACGGPASLRGVAVARSALSPLHTFRSLTCCVKSQRAIVLIVYLGIGNLWYIFCHGQTAWTSGRQIWCTPHIGHILGVTATCTSTSTMWQNVSQIQGGHHETTGQRFG